MIKLRSAKVDDTSAIVALNDAVVAVTSPMDHARFNELLEMSKLCVVAEQEGDVVGFVLAMQNGAPYVNGNFEWFSDRLNKFVYIDRIVIAETGRGHGLGSRLYDHVAEVAKQNGRLVMAAEMDLVPPNEESLKFHKKSGFVALGARELESGKVVSMQVRGL